MQNLPGTSDDRTLSFSHNPNAISIAWMRGWMMRFLQICLGVLGLVYVPVAVLGLVEHEWFYYLGPAFVLAFLATVWVTKRREP